MVSNALEGEKIMKKIISIALVLVMMMSISAAAFAATGPNEEYFSSYIEENYFTPYLDAKTGLSFDYPDTWHLSIDNQWAYGNSGRSSSRIIILTSITGEYKIEFIELTSMNQGIVTFLVIENEDNYHFVSTSQPITYIGGLFIDTDTLDNLGLKDLDDSLAVLSTVQIK